MDSKKFNDLLQRLPELKKEEIRELEENDLVVDFDEEREEVYVLLWKKVYIFDQEGYKNFYTLWDKGILTPDKNGYLCVKDKDWRNLIFIHNYLKRAEVEKLAKELNCPTQDIHVHHKDKDERNNRLNNLEVLHKDVHANRHGFSTWEEFQNWRKSKNKIQGI